MLCIFHADGNRELRETHAEYLTARGFLVRTAGGGVDCVEQIRQSAPDLLILDLELPWGGGAGVLGVMREESGLCQIPVVLTTTLSSAEALNELRQPPVVATFAKPFKMAELLERIVRSQKTTSRTDKPCPSDSLARSDSQADELVMNLEREIQLRTARQVRDLRVTRGADAVLVRGKVMSYYAKQLVLVAAMACLAGRGIELRFDVEVD